MKYNIERCIPISHPSLAGHFPGNPIVPAVLILNEVFIACNDWQPALRVCGIDSAKFVAPLLPDQIFDISLVISNKGAIKFECRTNSQILATGKLQTTDFNS